MHAEYTAPPRGRLAPEAARPYLIAEFGHRCFRCGLEPDAERPKMDVDHIIPVARGGGNYYGNYQFLCGPCNSWKGTQVFDFRPGGPHKIDAGLPIIPNEERVRKVPVKAVPDPVPVIQTVVERVQVPIMIPIPPPSHNCYDALPRLFGEYTRSQDEITRLAEKAGRLEAERRDYEHRWERASDRVPFVLFLWVAVFWLIGWGRLLYLWWMG